MYLHSRLGVKINPSDQVVACDSAASGDYALRSRSSRQDAPYPMSQISSSAFQQAPGMHNGHDMHLPRHEMSTIEVQPQVPRRRFRLDVPVLLTREYSQHRCGRLDADWWRRSRGGLTLSRPNTWHTAKRCRQSCQELDHICRVSTFVIVNSKCMTRKRLSTLFILHIVLRIVRKGYAWDRMICSILMLKSHQCEENRSVAKKHLQTTAMEFPSKPISRTPSHPSAIPSNTPARPPHHCRAITLARAEIRRVGRSIVRRALRRYLVLDRAIAFAVSALRRTTGLVL